jgi:hypothetical protein
VRCQPLTVVWFVEWYHSFKFIYTHVSLFQWSVSVADLWMPSNSENLTETVRLRSRAVPRLDGLSALFNGNLDPLSQYLMYLRSTLGGPSEKEQTGIKRTLNLHLGDTWYINHVGDKQDRTCPLSERSTVSIKSAIINAHTVESVYVTNKASFIAWFNCEKYMPSRALFAGFFWDKKDVLWFEKGNKMSSMRKGNKASSTSLLIEKSE